MALLQCLNINGLQTNLRSHGMAKAGDSAAILAQKSQKVAINSQRVAQKEISQPIDEKDDSGNNSHSSHSSHPMACPQPVPSCAVCGKTDRWDDDGVLRCKAYWSPGSLDAKANREQIRTCHTCGNAGAPVPDPAYVKARYVLMRCPGCHRPRRVLDTRKEDEDGLR